ncbi:MAG: Trehalose/maltose import ATP-binding protein MalK [Candidatus Bathyarchaeota archaeon BA1]|nr:MAG: Trehalose/maltose import ATP-binding protein MalK [Candidatus Bathyarchaeota archaeon BA1]
MTEKILLEVTGLKKYFPITRGFFGKRVGWIKAVDDVSFEIDDGETFALVGESGSGKTTTGRTVIRIFRPTAGDVIFGGENISNLKEKELKPWRRRMQIVYQDPTLSLNPRKRIADIITMPMDIHKIGTKRERLKRIEELMRIVGIPLKYIHSYPHALSGGQRQRVCIARALAPNPDFIVLDEPTSSLDVSVQAKILTLLSKLQKRFRLTYLFISHNLSVVRNISDHIAVMYLGKIVEMAPTKELFMNPLHPYTKALLSAIPVTSEDELEIIPEKVTLTGEIPSPTKAPSGCVFHTRCYRKMKKCEVDLPQLIEIKKNHHVGCHVYN